ncbi:hypothetical protein POVCU1_034660 [Plasmodium ovale curtisi]|uniref:Spindle assembly abnormal protein 4 n=1 Tax=Plasmodium ovale curtisi TaxID=864141 RepID=A0A1A8WZU9_PLAOA|nr:hypothetical protein POVCU1_034660 [Plasmodium ovale curtisi]
MKKRNEDFDDYYDVYEENWTHDTFAELEYTQSLEKNIQNKLNKKESQQNIFFCASDKVELNNSNESQLSQCDKGGTDKSKKLKDGKKDTCSEFDMCGNREGEGEKNQREGSQSRSHQSKSHQSGNRHSKIAAVVNKSLVRSSVDMDDRNSAGLNDSKKSENESYLLKDIYEELEMPANDNKSTYSLEDEFSKINNDYFMEKLEINSSNNQSDSAEANGSSIFQIDQSAMNVWDNMQDSAECNYDVSGFHDGEIEDDAFDEDLFGDSPFNNIEHECRDDKTNREDSFGNHTGSIFESKNCEILSERKHELKSSSSFSIFLKEHLETSKCKQGSKDDHFLEGYNINEKNMEVEDEGMVNIRSDLVCSHPSGHMTFSDSPLNLKGKRNILPKSKKVCSDKHINSCNDYDKRDFLNGEYAENADSRHVNDVSVVTSDAYIGNSGYSSVNNAHGVDRDTHNGTNDHDFEDTSLCNGTRKWKSPKTRRKVYSTSRAETPHISSELLHSSNELLHSSNELLHSSNGLLHSTNARPYSSIGCTVKKDDDTSNNTGNAEGRCDNCSRSGDSLYSDNSHSRERSVYLNENIRDTLQRKGRDSKNCEQPLRTSCGSSGYHTDEANDKDETNDNPFTKKKSNNLKFKKKYMKESDYLNEDEIRNIECGNSREKMQRRQDSPSNNDRKVATSAIPSQFNHHTHNEQKENKKKGELCRSSTDDNANYAKRKKERVLEGKTCNSNDSTDICVDLNDEESWDDMDSGTAKNGNLRKRSVQRGNVKKGNAQRGNVQRRNLQRRFAENGLVETLKRRDKRLSKEKGDCEKEELSKREKDETKYENIEKKDGDVKLKELGNELNNQINKLEKEQDKVKKLEYELIAKSAEIELEREEMKNKIDEEKKKMIKTIEEEKKKWSKEKKRIENEVDKQRNIITNKRKLTNEIAMFKNKIKELEEKMQIEKKQHKIIVDKLKKKVENLTIDNEKLKMELKISDEYRNKLENYQQKTIMRLATTVGDKKQSKQSHYTGMGCNHDTDGLHLGEETMDNDVANGQRRKGEGKFLHYMDESECRRKKNDFENCKDYENGKNYEDCEDYEKSEEVLKIINLQKDRMQSESDIMYETSNSDRENGKNGWLRKGNPLIGNSKDHLNNKEKNKKITFDKLFVRKENTKNVDPVKTEEEYINKNLNRLKSIIGRNKNRLKIDRVGNEEDKSSFTTSERSKNCKQFFFENCTNVNDNSSNKNDATCEKIKRKSDPTKHGYNCSLLNNLTTEPKFCQADREKDRDELLLNLKANTSITNSNIKNDDVGNYQHVNKQKKDYTSHIIDNISNRPIACKKSQQILNRNEGDSSELLGRFSYDEYVKKTEQNGKEKKSKQVLHYMDNYSTDEAHSNHQQGVHTNPFVSPTHGDKSNTKMSILNENIHARNKLTEVAFSKGDTPTCSGEILNPFGKDWDFIINFDFDELFNRCENVIESVFSSSKKIKYRQAFIDGKVETLFEDGVKIIEKNKNKKIIDPSNMTIYLYPSKDYRARLPNSYTVSRFRHLFRFVSKGIYQVNIPNKCQLNKFPSGQVDCKYSDGHMQILFCDGRRKEILPNKEEYNQKVMLEPEVPLEVVLPIY